MSDFQYTEAKVLLERMVKNRDHAFAKIFLNNIFPVLSKGDQESIKTYTAKTVFQSNDIEMHAVFIEHFGMSDEDAHHYIESRLDNRELDRELLVSAVKGLGSYYGASLFNAIGSGDIEVLREIDTQHGIRKVNVRYSTKRMGTYVDNEPVGYTQKLKVADASELKEVVSYAFRAGLINKNLRGEYPISLFDSDHLETSIGSVACDTWNEIPVIKEGMIAHGEIVDAFKKEATGIGSDVYRRIPVFVHKDYRTALTTARVFIPEHKAAVYTGALSYGATREKFPDDYVDYSVSSPDQSLFELTNAQGERYIDCLSSFVMTVKAEANDSSDKFDEHDNALADAIALDEALISEMLPAVYRYGLGYSKDYVLAVVDIEELSELAFKAFAPNSVERAREYTKNFFPLNLVEANYCVSTWKKIKVGQVGYRDGSTYAANLFNALADDHNLAERFFGAVDKRLINNLLGKSWNMKPAAIGFIQRAIGITIPQPVKLESADSAIELEKSGFKFNHECRSIRKEFGYKPTVESESALIRMGVWPDGSIPEPISVVEGLKALVRRPDNQALRAYVTLQGIEAVCSAAKTDSQWNMVQSVFPNESEMLLKHGPKKLKRGIVAGGLDI